MSALKERERFRFDCPFCGTAPTVENTVTQAVIRCGPCGVTMVVRHARHCDEPGIKLVHEKWNTRVIKAAQR